MSWREKLHPKQSKLELQVLANLNEAGIFPLTDHGFCLLSTTPDFYFPDKRLAVYLDGEKVHRNRLDQDEELRELLKKRYGMRVLTIPYKRYSRNKSMEVVAQIKEACSS